MSKSIHLLDHLFFTEFLVVLRFSFFLEELSLSAKKPRIYLVQKFKNLIFLFVIFFSHSIFAQEITLVWGNTLSKLIFQYHSRDLSNWKELLPLYLSLNPRIANSNLIYAENKLIIPAEEEVLAFLNSQDSIDLDDLGANEASQSFDLTGGSRDIASGEDLKAQRKIASLINYVSSPWSLDLQAGPYFKYNGSSTGSEYLSDGGFNFKAKGTYYFNDQYSVGVSGRYVKQSYSLTSGPISFNLAGVYVEVYKNWNKFVISALFGFRDRLVFASPNQMLMARHLDYGVGIDYRLLRGKRWEALVGFNFILFMPSTTLEENLNQKGYDVKARVKFNYQLWGNSLVGLESVYNLSKGQNALYNTNLEDFVTRLRFQFNF